MEIEQLLNNRILSSELSTLLQFGISNLKRSIGLYGLFDEVIENEKLERLCEGRGVDLLNSYLQQIEEIQFNFNPTLLEKMRESVCSLIPDDEDYGGLESDLAQFFTTSFCSLIDFLKNKDKSDIVDFSKQVIELINIVESEKFYSSNPDGDADEYLDECFEKEFEFQILLISLIEDGQLTTNIILENSIKL